MSGSLEVRDLNLWYGTNQALQQVNVSVPEHEITALIGPSGCGKSTFLKALNRMNDLIPSVRTQGEVIYREKISTIPRWTPHGSGGKSAWCFKRPIPSP